MKYVLKWTGFIALFILVALVVAALRTGSCGLWIPIVTAIGTVIGAIILLIYSLCRKDIFFASDIRTLIASKVADKLFEKFVIPGNGDEQVDALIYSNN